MDFLSSSSSSTSSGRRTFSDILKEREGVKFGKHDGNKKEQAPPSLMHVVLNWTLPDILDKNFDKHKIEKIPETFSSAEHYLTSYKYPLIAETHADMLSSMSLLSLAPICAVISIEKSKDYDKESYSLYYDVTIATSVANNDERGLYEPQIWDVIALSNVIPSCIDDLNRPPCRYLPAMILGIERRRDDTVLKIYSKSICFHEHQKKKRGAVFMYATFLINMTTNMRIWGALNGAQRNLNLINRVLDADLMAMDRCDICSSQDTPVSKQDLNVDLKSMNLNESQTNAVLSSIETSICSHRNSVTLIWGPPGTGKTKTISTILWVLLTMECRTVTCAPTNIAVVQVASCFLKLVRAFIKGDMYGLGDILLFGSDKSLKVDDQEDLSAVYFNHRVARLANCFTPLTGWRNRLNSMISLLEDPISQYRRYKKDPQELQEVLHGDKEKDTHDTKKNILKKEKTGKEDVQSMGSKKQDVTCDKVLTFLEFIRRTFGDTAKGLECVIQNMCTHLPTSVLSVRVAVMMKKVLNLLKSLKMSLFDDTLSSEELEKSFENYEELDHTANKSFASSLVIVAKKCLQLLKSISESKLPFPEDHDINSIRKFCLENACIILCTASKSANLHEVQKPFEMLIIDEAAQLKECESVIPLQLPGVRHAVLIGDERQLPAMIRSKISDEAEFGRSLFKRLVSLGQKKHLLSIQYRMHPSISLFPNSEFYGKEISDAPNVQDENYKKHLIKGNMYGSYSFINVTYGKEVSSVGHSLRNMEEVAVIGEIVAKLYQASVGSGGQMISVGVISPYKSQVFALQEELGPRFRPHRNFSLSIRSVDGFQGGEEDVIIISTVRSNGNGSVGFLSDHQRTNVALTRARYCLWILGNGPTLIKSESVWTKLVLDAQKRGCYFNADEDETLVKALLESMKRDQFDDLLNINSMLFRSARWKVIFCDDFWKSLARQKDDDTRKELVELLMKLSNGWRHPSQQQRTISPMDDGSTSSQLLEQYMVKDLLYLVWSVDVVKEGLKLIQVLKVWDITPLPEVPSLAERLDDVFESYTVANMNRCKFKCLEGEMAIPMSWDISPAEAVRMENIWKYEHEQLSAQLGSSLRLNKGRGRSTRFSRGRGRKSSSSAGRGLLRLPETNDRLD